MIFDYFEIRVCGTLVPFVWRAKWLSCMFFSLSFFSCLRNGPTYPT